MDLVGDGVKFDRPDPKQRLLAFVNEGRVEYAAFVSAGRVEYAKPGWFLHLVGERVHWYDPVKVKGGDKMVRRLCDGVAAFPTNLFEPGNWPSCLRCRRIIRGARP